jgi:hypothetical protein
VELLSEISDLKKNLEIKLIAVSQEVLETIAV